MIPASYAPREPPPDITKPILGRVANGACTARHCRHNRPRRAHRVAARTDSVALDRGLDLLDLILAEEVARLDPRQDARLADRGLLDADRVDLPGDLGLVDRAVEQRV